MKTAQEFLREHRPHGYQEGSVWWNVILPALEARDLEFYRAGQEATMKWVSEECKRNTERLTSGAWLKDVLADAKLAKSMWPDWAKK